MQRELAGVPEQYAGLQTVLTHWFRCDRIDRMTCDLCEQQGKLQGRK